MSTEPSPDIWRQRIQLGIAVTLVILAISDFGKPYFNIGKSMVPEDQRDEMK